MKEAYGPNGLLAFELVLMTQAFGTMCSYLIVLGDVFLPLVSLFTGIEIDRLSRFVVLCMCLLAVFALFLVRAQLAATVSLYLNMGVKLLLIWFIFVRGFQSLMQGNLVVAIEKHQFYLFKLTREVLRAFRR